MMLSSSGSSCLRGEVAEEEKKREVAFVTFPARDVGEITFGEAKHHADKNSTPAPLRHR